MGGGPAARRSYPPARLHKHLPDTTLKLTVPAHTPVKRSTLSHILKQADMSVEKLNTLLSD